MKKWKVFEKVVAAVHRVEAEGGTVSWNEQIGGRQFDVAIRFKKAFYDFLVVIECKDESRSVSVDAVEAFVTKSRDAGADKGVMASSSGFQSGCVGVAERHNVDLITVTQEVIVPEDALTGLMTPALRAFDFTLNLADGSAVQLPEARGELGWLLRTLCVDRFRGERSQTSLQAIFEHEMYQNGKEVSLKEQEFTVAMEAGTTVTLPYSDDVAGLASISFSCFLDTINVLTYSGLDPNLQFNSYIVENARTGVRRNLSVVGTPLDAGTTILAGNYYFMPSLESYYYCLQVEGGIGHFLLVESYQLNELFQAEFEQEIVHSSKHMWPVNSEEDIRRLEWLRNRIATTS